jgi:hypothetical protein
MEQIYGCQECGWEGPLEQLDTKWVGQLDSEDVIPEPICPVCKSPNIKLIKVGVSLN